MVRAGTRLMVSLWYLATPSDGRRARYMTPRSRSVPRIGGDRSMGAVTQIRLHTEAPSSSLACPALAGAQRSGCWGAGVGCVVQLLVNVDQDGVVFDLACVNRDGAGGKRADGLAGGQVVA